MAVVSLCFQGKLCDGCFYGSIIPAWGSCLCNLTHPHLITSQCPSPNICTWCLEGQGRNRALGFGQMNGCGDRAWLSPQQRWVMKFQSNISSSIREQAVPSAGLRTAKTSKYQNCHNLLSSGQVHTIFVQGRDVHNYLWLYKWRDHPGLHRNPAVKQGRNGGRRFSKK